TRLADVDRGRRRRARIAQERVPGEVGGERGGGGERQLVVIGVGVAPLDASERRVGERRLERENAPRLGIGHGRRVAQQAERAGDVLEVRGAQGAGGGVVAHVVVAVG